MFRCIGISNLRRVTESRLRKKKKKKRQNSHFHDGTKWNNNSTKRVEMKETPNMNENEKKTLRNYNRNFNFSITNETSSKFGQRTVLASSTQFDKGQNIQELLYVKTKIQRGKTNEKNNIQKVFFFYFEISTALSFH